MKTSMGGCYLRPIPPSWWETRYQCCEEGEGGRKRGEERKRRRKREEERRREKKREEERRRERQGEMLKKVG